MKTTPKHELEVLMDAITIFNQERDWDQFHSPKNLAMNLCVEVAEIAESFRWCTEEKSNHLPESEIKKVGEEVGDVLINLLNLCHKLRIDPIQATYDKIQKLSIKYPKELCRGKSLKYTNYEGVEIRKAGELEST